MQILSDATGGPFQALLRRCAIPARLSRPVPNSQTAAGTGTELKVGVNDGLPLNDAVKDTFLSITMSLITIPKSVV